MNEIIIYQNNDLATVLKFRIVQQEVGFNYGEYATITKKNSLN